MAGTLEYGEKLSTRPGEEVIIKGKEWCPTSGKPGGLVLGPGNNIKKQKKFHFLKGTPFVLVFCGAFTFTNNSLYPGGCALNYHQGKGVELGVVISWVPFRESRRLLARELNWEIIEFIWVSASNKEIL